MLQTGGYPCLEVASKTTDDLLGDPPHSRLDVCLQPDLVVPALLKVQ